jgi:oligopeptidase B
VSIRNDALVFFPKLSISICQHNLVTTSLNDSQVGYWEPAKYTAKLRALKTDKNKLLFKINMEAGHGGASGRYDYLKELAFEYCVMLSMLGIEQ